MVLAFLISRHQAALEICGSADSRPTCGNIAEMWPLLIRRLPKTGNVARHAHM